MSLLSDCTPENFETNETCWRQQLENPDFWSKIPLLNVHETHNFQEGCLVRFQGMVQDMHSPQFYMEKYTVLDKTTNEKTVKSGKYRHKLAVGDNELVVHEDAQSVTGEKHTYVVISTPAINKWVYEQQCETNKIELSTTAKPGGFKRSLDEDEDMETDTTATTTTNQEACKKNKTESTSLVATATVSKEHILNFPIPDSPGKKCHIEIYEKSEDLKLNDNIEIVGFLSNDPFVESYNKNEDNQMETETHHPPSSLVPTIHCITYKKIVHNNPFVVANITDPMATDKVQFIRKELLIVLTQLLLGDDLAAEYLICHLISRIYMRRDFMALGKFSLNLSNIPQFEQIDYTKTLYDFLEMLVPKSHYFPMTLDNMNDLCFTPKKDYECNRLTSGLLQLTANTHLVLDETKLSAGKLNSAGIDNVKAVATCIKRQKLDYDFVYYRIEYDCDIPFLILSEGKTMLTSDCQVDLRPDENCMNTLEEIIDAAKHFLKPELLNEIRRYLTLARFTEYEFNDQIQDLIQQDFVKMRQKENATSPEQLHNLLVFARLLSLSEGKNTLDETCWKRACLLEEARRARIPQNK